MDNDDFDTERVSVSGNIYELTEQELRRALVAYQNLVSVLEAAQERYPEHAEDFKKVVGITAAVIVDTFQDLYTLEDMVHVTDMRKRVEAEAEHDVPSWVKRGEA